jgi:pimeloyl-ACP methyl ester carboxylesterase
MKTKTLIILTAVVLSSCLKLDNNFYNKKAISSYQLDAYTGDQDFVLDQSYTIPASNLNLFTLPSQMKSEKSPVNIYALYIGDISRIATDTVILYCHGNKWHMDFYWQRAKLLAHVNGKNHYGVMMMDYRGYGASEGEPSEEGMYTDVDACMAWLKSKGLNSERLIIYGFSMGTASATELSSKPRTLTPSKLILEAPFASAAVMVQDAARLNMPGAYVTDLKIDNAEEIKHVKQPFLWIHGLNDTFLNYQTHGEVVYKNYGGTAGSNSLVQGADHGEVPAKMGFDAYKKLIGDFVVKH